MSVIGGQQLLTAYQFMRKVIINNLELLRLIYKYDYTLILILIIASLFGSFTTIYGIFAMGRLINILSTSEASLKNVIFILLSIAVLNICTILIESWKRNVYLPPRLNKIKLQIQMEIFDVMERVGLLEYDNPDFYELYSIGAQNVEARITSVINVFVGTLANMVSVISIISIFTSFSIDLMLLVIFNVTLSFFINIKISRLSFEQTQRVIMPQRRMNYVKRIFYLKEYEEEIQTSNISDALRNYYRMANNEVIQTIKFYGKINGKIVSIQGIIGIIFNSIIMLLLAYRTIVSKILMIGDFSALISAVNQVSTNLSKILNAGPEMYENSLYAEKYFEFMGYCCEHENANINVDDFNEIILKNVSFKFPGANTTVLENINMTINKGDFIAIIGENGSGKTTLTRILQKLYVPNEGNIMIDEYNYQEVTKTSIDKLIGTVHQDYRLFSLSIGENVLMRKIQDFDDDKLIVEKALDKVNLLKKLKDSNLSILTQLYKEIDENGMVMSGGEMQRIAIARIMAQKYKLVILDEATSNIDIMSEKKIFDELKKMGNTVILITHKISNIEYANKILVLQNGRIVENGTPDELIREKGIYYKMIMENERR